MQVRNIMTKTVIHVAPEASVLDAAALLVENRISAIPVVSGDAVVGIVSEADLLHRTELGTERDPAARPWWRRIFDRDSESLSYVEAHATKVRDVMSTPVFSIAEDMPVAELAALFETRKIKRAPVLKSGLLVGIVSRSDFVRALVARAKQGQEAQPKDDASIRRALLAELESQHWWHSDRSDVTVSDGVVRFAGQVDSTEEKTSARVAAENIPGVRAVEDSRSVEVPTAGYPEGGYL